MSSTRHGRAVRHIADAMPYNPELAALADALDAGEYGNAEAEVIRSTGYSSSEKVLAHLALRLADFQHNNNDTKDRATFAAMFQSVHDDRMALAVLRAVGSPYDFDVTVSRTASDAHR
jgi:hypothetical protein